MNPKDALKYVAETRARLLEIIEAGGATGVTNRHAAEAMAVSMGCCGTHIAALVSAGDVERIGAGNQARYRSVKFRPSIAQCSESERVVLVDGRRHVLSRAVVRSVFELGATA